MVIHTLLLIIPENQHLQLYKLALSFVLFALLHLFYFRYMPIDLKQLLMILKKGDWLSLRFITANLDRGTGGSVIEFAKCRIARNSVAQFQTADLSKPIYDAEGKFSKPANHNYNFTINVELQNGLIRKVHPILITHVNNQPVI